jgi:hypothetical protein
MVHEDLYGLRLSATAQAAQAYNAGLRRILLVQAGPEHDMHTAIRTDPGFALAHAGLALLGHEYGVTGVNVSRSLAVAAAAVAQRGTERERSQVAAVAAHVRGEGAAITSHLRAHPRDALMLGVAVPTIAFAGVTDVREEAWALVESLGPAYGDDWWYAAWHAAVALAAGRDTAGLARLGRYAASGPGRIFPSVVAPLVAGMQAYVEGRYDAASTLLMAVRPNAVALGGSSAQQEVIEDTLLDALLAAGRLTQARSLLARRLDRRPSRRDQRRLYQLAGFPESRPA